MNDYVAARLTREHHADLEREATERALGGMASRASAAPRDPTEAGPSTLRILVDARHVLAQVSAQRPLVHVNRH